MSATESSDSETSRTPVENPPQTPESKKSKKSAFSTPSSTVSPGSIKSTKAVSGSPVRQSTRAHNAMDHVGTTQTGADVLAGVGTGFGGAQSMTPYTGVSNDGTPRPMKRPRLSHTHSEPSPSRDTTSDDTGSDDGNGNSDTHQTKANNRGTKPGNGKDK